MMEPAYWLSEFADEKTKPFITPLGAKHPEALVKAELERFEGLPQATSRSNFLQELEASFMSMVQGLSVWAHSIVMSVSVLTTY